MEKLENGIVVDTNVLIKFLRGDSQAIELLGKLRTENILYTTDINAFELYYGAYKGIKQDENLAAVKGIINSLILLGTNEDCMEIAGKILVDLQKKGKGIEIRDLFIGSICLVNSLKLLTLNKKHFEIIEGLKLV